MQPWADFLVSDRGVVDRLAEVNPALATRLPKDVENRTYGTPYRGPFLVHASRDFDMLAARRFGLDPNRFVRGAVVGIVDLVDVVTDAESWWANPGAKHWRVTNPIRLLSPIDARGFQGFRVPDPMVLATVMAGLERQLAGVAG